MRSIFLALLFTSSLFATEYDPWLPPLLEFQGRVTYLFGHDDHVQSPKGSFKESDNDHTINMSLAGSIWPNSSVEVEVLGTQSEDISFTYQAAYITARYAWLNDSAGDCVSLVTGATVAFPGTVFLSDFSYPYHGHANFEVHATMGKEWTRDLDWTRRVWLLGGWGIADEGQGWLHSFGAVEFNPQCFEWGVFYEALFGLGSNDIIPNEPFEGYGGIGHQNVDVGAYVSRGTGCERLGCFGWYSVYARNFVEHSWGLGARWTVSFGL